MKSFFRYGFLIFTLFLFGLSFSGDFVSAADDGEDVFSSIYQLFGTSVHKLVSIVSGTTTDSEVIKEGIFYARFLLWLVMFSLLYILIGIVPPFKDSGKKGPQVAIAIALSVVGVVGLSNDLITYIFAIYGTVFFTILALAVVGLFAYFYYRIKDNENLKGMQHVILFIMLLILNTFISAFTVTTMGKKLVDGNSILVLVISLVGVGLLIAGFMLAKDIFGMFRGNSSGESGSDFFRGKSSRSAPTKNTLDSTEATKAKQDFGREVEDIGKKEKELENLSKKPNKNQNDLKKEKKLAEEIKTEIENAQKLGKTMSNVGVDVAESETRLNEEKEQVKNFLPKPLDKGVLNNIRRYLELKGKNPVNGRYIARCIGDLYHKTMTNNALKEADKLSDDVRKYIKGLSKYLKLANRIYHPLFALTEDKKFDLPNSIHSDLIKNMWIPLRDIKTSLNYVNEMVETSNFGNTSNGNTVIEFHKKFSDTLSRLEQSEYAVEEIIQKLVDIENMK